MTRSEALAYAHSQAEESGMPWSIYAHPDGRRSPVYTNFPYRELLITAGEAWRREGVVLPNGDWVVANG